MSSASSASRTAVVTGASAGLGAEYAKQLAALGYHLILVARRLDRLEALAQTLSVPVTCLECDLGDTDACAALAERLAARNDIHLLVNNAGFGTKGLFHQTDFHQQLQMHQVHIMATMRLTRAVLPAMIARNQGAVIQVSSVAGFSHSAQNVSYCATKHWLNSFTEGLHLELRSLNSAVQVQALCPGFTYTEFHDVLGADRSRIASSLWLKADYVVAASLRALETRTLFVVPNWKYRIFASLFPRLPLGLRLWAEARQPHKTIRES